MIGRGFKLAVLAAAVASAGGCRPEPLRPAVRLDLKGAAPRVDYGELADLLAGAVKDGGLLEPQEVRKRADRLDAQLKRLAVTGPTVTPDLFPTVEDRLAYWYNARAAWAVKLALIAGLPRQMPPTQLLDRPLPLDGRRMSLRRIDQILARDADWGVLVASPCVLLQRAALPTTPFSAADVRSRVAERIDAFIDDDRRVVIDVQRRRIPFPPVLWRWRDWLIAQHHQMYRTRGAVLSTALLPYVTGSASRRLQDAVGYANVPARPSGRLALTKQRRRRLSATRPADP